MEKVTYLQPRKKEQRQAVYKKMAERFTELRNACNLTAKQHPELVTKDWQIFIKIGNEMGYEPTWVRAKCIEAGVAKKKKENDNTGATKD